MTSTGGPAASWYPDPTGRHEHRYWDGERWTVHVADNGVTGVDGPAQPPAAQQQAVVHEQRTSTAGWAPVPERPTPTPQYAWQPSSPTSALPVSAGAATPGRSSRGRGWIFAIAIVVAIAGIGATAMVALGRNDDSTTSATSGGGRYPAIVETNFMTGCTSTGGNESFCRCALDRLEQDYDLDEFADAEQSYLSSGKLPDSMMSAVRDCVSHLYQQ